jgi:peptidoglycan/xylan/chitin deacetylase (PgdA/CDA1 family)
MPPARVALYFATAAVLVLTVRSIVLSPPPLAWSIAAMAAYVAWILCGVLILRLRMFTDAVVSGPKRARGVALTFDDGPDPEHTPRVLDALEAAGARGTFFLIGKKADAHPDIVRDIARRGHAVGVHSYAHDRLFSLRGEKRVRADLEKAIASLEKITGERPKLFRPPIGHTNPIIARVADALDLIVVGWSVSGRDGVKSAVPERVAARIRGRLKDRAIVLMHDAAERGDYAPAGPRALPEVLEAIAEQRLDVVPLSAWVE